MYKRGSFEDTLSIVSVISIEQKNRREATRRRECYRLNRFRTRIHRQDGELGFLSLSYDNSLGRWYSMILDLCRSFLQNCSEINVVYLSRSNIFYRRHKEMHVQRHLIIANNYWRGFSSLLTKSMIQSSRGRIQFRRENRNFRSIDLNSCRRKYLYMYIPLQYIKDFATTRNSLRFTARTPFVRPSKIDSNDRSVPRSRFLTEIPVSSTRHTFIQAHTSYYPWEYINGSVFIFFAYGSLT